MKHWNVLKDRHKQLKLDKSLIRLADGENSTAASPAEEVKELRKQPDIGEAAQPRKKSGAKKISPKKQFLMSEEYQLYFTGGERPVRIYVNLIIENLLYFKFVKCPRAEKCSNFAILKGWANFSCRDCPIAEELRHQFQPGKG